MAVAVKNPPIAGASSPLDRLPIVSLVGAAYVAVSLGVVLDGLPYLWRTYTGLTDVGGSVLLGLIMLAAITVLAVLGVRLYGSQRPVGARAGVFMGLVGVVVVLLLTRWASLWLEYWIYANGWLGNSPKVGLAVTGAVLVVLLAGLAYLFFRPRTEAFLVGLEAQGWFSAAAYKGQQGQRVRRATILAILLLGGSGVYTMMNNGFLHRLPESLYLNVPFTGTAPVLDAGDAGRAGLIKDLPEKDKDQVQIVAHGASSFKDGAVVSAQEFRNALKARIEAAADLDPKTKTQLADEVDGPKKKDITDLLNLPSPSDAAAAALGPLALEVVPPPGLPTALLRLDPTVLRNVNADLASRFVVVTDAKDSNLKNGAVVSTKTFDAEADRLKSLGLTPPEKQAPYPIASPGPTNARLTLLPALQYTLPLLLIALTLWVAWRIVNYPAFADFLIATEAELNKVSWTTRPRLIQDTIVVLITTLLLAVFLFLMDQTWRVILSWKPIGVLQIDNEKIDKSAEQKMW